jgi:receptor protein-tyrosine kinase
MSAIETMAAEPTVNKPKQLVVDLSVAHGLKDRASENDFMVMSEQFRMIKRPILNNAFGAGDKKIENGNLIMVTSCFPGEGKSFTTLNLAMNIALEMDRTVLLVDADVSKPTMFKSLGLQPQKGLLDLLVDPSLSPADVLVKTSVSNLTLLPAGTSNPKATELLASDSMVRLLSDMASRYSDRIIIFDSPPLLVTTESSVLASHMGQIIMVVEAGKTTYPAVRNALSMVDECGYVGIILNKAEYQLGFDQFAYGYGYGRAEA